jgi:hypothetical protein
VPLQAARAQERERRLARHVNADHPLHGSVRALATRGDDAQTTLFLLEETERLYLVPMVQLGKAAAHELVFSTFDSFESFSEACMMPDHLKHSAAPGH